MKQDNSHRKGTAMNKRNPALILFAILLIAPSLHTNSYATGSMKLWSNMCASCHDGKTAPDMESLRLKYMTIDAFSVAVKSRGHQCMNILKNDESLIKKIGREIGLKDTEQK
jgi:hypothetical protein